MIQSPAKCYMVAVFTVDDKCVYSLLMAFILTIVGIDANSKHITISFEVGIYVSVVKEISLCCEGVVSIHIDSLGCPIFVTVRLRTALIMPQLIIIMGYIAKKYFI